MLVFISRSYSTKDPMPQDDLQARFERFRDELWCRKPHASGMDGGYTISISVPMRTPSAARALWAAIVEPVLEEVGLGADVAAPLGDEPNVMYVVDETTSPEGATADLELVEAGIAPL